uniref:Putative neurotoxin LTDF 01-25 n=1 Tax=Dolomedes fimbriatus TaxID=1432569 RepID=A0A0K1D853_9ARAC|nr:putative neurotoxin LTDF 01-25 [Dolomedes fimbriatus]
MKILLVFISVLYLVHSFTLEENEALASLEEIALREAEPLQAEDAVDEEARACIPRGQSCKSDCDCCAGDWDQCNFWGTCVQGTARDCFDKQENCKVKPKNVSVVTKTEETQVRKLSKGESPNKKEYWIKEKGKCL